MESFYSSQILAEITVKYPLHLGNIHCIFSRTKLSDNQYIKFLSRCNVEDYNENEVDTMDDIDDSGVFDDVNNENNKHIYYDEDGNEISSGSEGSSVNNTNDTPSAKLENDEISDNAKQDNSSSHIAAQQSTRLPVSNNKCNINCSMFDGAKVRQDEITDASLGDFVNNDTNRCETEQIGCRTSNLSNRNVYENCDSSKKICDPNCVTVNENDLGCKYLKNDEFTLTATTEHFTELNEPFTEDESKKHSSKSQTALLSNGILDMDVNALFEKSKTGEVSINTIALQDCIDRSIKKFCSEKDMAAATIISSQIDEDIVVPDNELSKSSELIKTRSPDKISNNLRSRKSTEDNNKYDSMMDLIQLLGYEYLPNLYNGSEENDLSIEVIHMKYKKSKIVRSNRGLPSSWLNTSCASTEVVKLTNDDTEVIKIDDKDIVPESAYDSDMITEDITVVSTESVNEKQEETDSKVEVFLKQSKKKKKNKKPVEGQKFRALRKYWVKRYSLFSKFDEGIRLDEESWYSVTPECAAEYIAERCRSDLIVDAFCGAGGNTIQFAFTCERVIGIDIDPEKIQLAVNNAKVYGVDDRIEFIVGDFFQIAPTLKGVDAIFLSPPWGGPDYAKATVFSLDSILETCGGGKHLFKVARQVTENIAYFLPRQTNVDEILDLAKEDGCVEIEQHILNKKPLAVTAYYGTLIQGDENNGDEY